MRNMLEIPEVFFEDNTSAKIIKCDALQPFDIEDYDLSDANEFNKHFIPDIEKVCRQSREYQKLVGYLRENMNMNKCSFLENVTNQNSFKIKIHLHHEPFTLYDIAKTVYNKRLDRRERTTVNMIAQEVMYLHYTLLIGLIPLSETVHELVHNNYLFIPLDKVFGGVQEFVNRYEPYFDEDLALNWKNYQEYNKTYTEGLMKNQQLLERQYIYYNMDEDFGLPKFQSIIDAMQNRIDELRKEKDIRDGMIVEPEVEYYNGKMLLFKRLPS